MPLYLNIKEKRFTDRSEKIVEILRKLCEQKKKYCCGEIMPEPHSHICGNLAEIFGINSNETLNE